MSRGALFVTSRSLAAGIATAVALVTTWTFVRGVWAGCATQNCTIPLGVQVSFAFVESFVDALVLGLSGAIIWQACRAMRVANVWAAMLTGCALPWVFWVTTNLPAINGKLDLVVSGLPYALAGLIAGYVCWITGDGSRRRIR